MYTGSLTRLDVLSGQTAAVLIGLGVGEVEHLHLVSDRLPAAQRHRGEGVGIQAGGALATFQSQRLSTAAGHDRSAGVTTHHGLGHRGHRSQRWVTMRWFTMAQREVTTGYRLTKIPRVSKGH